MADNLEYRIGKIEIDTNKIYYNYSQEQGIHRFVIELADSNHVGIYVAVADRHSQVANKFNLKKERLVGGGSCYINADRQLVLDGFSGAFGSIPRKAAQIFAELLVPELQKQGIQTTGVVADPKSKPHEFWKGRGFC